MDRFKWFSWVLFFISVQFSRSVMSDSLGPDELQHARPPCPPPTPRVHSNSHPYMTTGKTIALTRRTFVGTVISLLLNMLSGLVITFLPRSSVQFSHSVTSNSLWPHELPVHHQLPEFTQTHVHQVGDAIQPSHPLSSASPPAPNPSHHQSLFQWVNSSHEVAKVLKFQL